MEEAGRSMSCRLSMKKSLYKRSFRPVYRFQYKGQLCFYFDENVKSL